MNWVIPSSPSARLAGSLIALSSLVQPSYGQSSPDVAAGQGVVPEVSAIEPTVDQRREASATQVPLMTIDLEGNSIYSDEDLAEVTSAYVGRDVAAADLLEMRERLIRYYVERGYGDASAFIPDQAVIHGRMVVHITEDRLSEIVIGNETCPDWLLVWRRINHGFDPNLYASLLKAPTELLLPARAIGRLSERLKPRVRPIGCRHGLSVEEAPLYRSDMTFDVTYAGPMEPERGDAQLVLVEATGQSDLVSFGFDRPNAAAFKLVGYARPLDAGSFRLVSIDTAASTQTGVAPKAQIGAASGVRAPGTGLMEPFLPPNKRGLRPAAFLERKRRGPLARRTPLPLSEGTRNGKSEIAAPGLRQNAQRRANAQRWGLPSIHSPTVDVVQTTRYAGIGDAQLHLDPLLAVEQVSLRDGNPGRGKKNQSLVLEGGWIVATALQVPIGRLTVPGVAGNPDEGLLSISPFIDTGSSWTNTAQEDRPSDPYSIGAGVGWQITHQTDLRFGIDLPLIKTDVPESDGGQDLGFQFRLATELGD